MIKLITLRSCFIFILFLHGNLRADEKSETLEMQEAINEVSDPNADGKSKHVALITLQGLKNPQSIDALYENIDFVSKWGSQTQRTMENSYPATYALILIGKPSIEGAARYLRANPSTEPEKLWLIASVVYEVFRSESNETYGHEFPKTDEKTFEWLKKNCSNEMLEIISKKLHLPPLKGYLKSLPVQATNPASQTSQALHKRDGVSSDSTPARAFDSKKNTAPMINAPPQQQVFQPVSSNKLSWEKPVPAPSGQFPSSTLWAVLVVLIGGASGVRWLVFKSRK